MMNGYTESDSLIVSENPLNEVHDNKRMPMGENRRRLKGIQPSKTGAGTEPDNSAK